MNKIYTAWICITIVALLLPACGKSNADPDCPRPEIFCVGLVTTAGGKIDDHALNQAAWEGLQKAETELGVIASYIETNDWRDYAKNISTFGNVGYDMIITVGPSIADETITAAAQYPQSVFIGVDQPEIRQSNLITLTFPTDQAGFMAGALAALVTKKEKIGGVFASDEIPSVWRLGEGYRAGAEYINPDLEVSIVYHSSTSTDGEETTEEIPPDPGLDPTQIDPEWGAAQATALVESDADIIFASGDETGNAALVSAVANGALVIGFDADQYFTLSEAKSGMLTSIVKKVSPLVFILVKAFQDSRYQEDLTVLYRDLEYLGYSEELLYWLSFGDGPMEYTPFHEFDDKISDEVRARIEEIQAGLFDRTITTGVPREKPGPVPAPTESVATPAP